MDTLSLQFALIAGLPGIVLFIVALWLMIRGRKRFANESRIVKIMLFVSTLFLFVMSLLALFVAISLVLFA